MTTIQISVTAEIIAEAEQRRETSFFSPFCDCPVALAVRKRIPHASVGRVEVASRKVGCILLPLSARNFIRAFDAGEAVEPLVFELEVSGD